MIYNHSVSQNPAIHEFDDVIAVGGPVFVVSDLNDRRPPVHYFEYYKSNTKGPGY